MPVSLTNGFQSQIEVENVRPLGVFLRDVMKQNMHNFREFGPDETTSNKLDNIYEVSKKTWLEQYLPEDIDGGELGPDGRVMEMLSEHMLEGVAGRLPAQRTPWFPFHIRIIRPRDRFNDQPTCKVAGEKQRLGTATAPPPRDPG